MSAIKRFSKWLHDPRQIDHLRLVLEGIAALGAAMETKALWFKVLLGTWFLVDSIAAIVAYKCRGEKEECKVG